MQELATASHIQLELEKHLEILFGEKVNRLTLEQNVYYKLKNTKFSTFFKRLM
jgi:hypothetical protein